MATKKFQSRMIPKELTEYSDIRCTCGKVNNRTTVSKFVVEATKSGKIVKKHVLERFEKLKKSGIKGVKQQEELDNIYEEGKTQIQGELRRIMDQLDMPRDCCRVLLADTARKGYETDASGKAIYFDAEDYYDFDKFKGE